MTTTPPLPPRAARAQAGKLRPGAEPAQNQVVSGASVVPVVTVPAVRQGAEIFQMENGVESMANNAAKPTTPRATRTRKATPDSTPDSTTQATLLDVKPDSIERNQANPERAAIVARIKGYAGTIRENSTLLLADVLTLCAGIPAKEWKAVLQPEIGAQRVGKVLTRGDAQTLVKQLRDPARNGGKITTEDVAAVLGIGVGTVNRHEKATDETDPGTGDGATDGEVKPAASGVDLLKKIEADLAKALKRDDATSEEFITRLTLLMVAARKGLPGGVDTNNRGGQG
ncbi:hypothetical protein [Micromonospora sp. WMMD736]|uniref:hypothetical protein n=1 Tax=Micromonospora sp. WMMD736 TaxID=3404112 RepID=UPI003B966A99